MPFGGPTIRRTTTSARAVGRIAVLPWGDLIEDFLSGLGLTLEEFRDQMTGGWLFGYVEALRRAEIATTIICVSAQVDAVTRWTHRPSGARLCLLPAPAAYRALRRRMEKPLAASAAETFPRARVPGAAGVLKDVASYLATPPRVLARAIESEGCDAILCQEYEYARFDVCVAVARRVGCRVFGVFQGGNFQVSRLERFVRPLTMRAADGVIVADADEIARVQRCYGARVPVARIANPLDLETWRPQDRAAARAALGLPATAQVVAWHGRIDMRRKGLDVLVAAWEELCREQPERDLRLLIVGSGEDATAFRALCAARRVPNVSWLDRYVLDAAVIRRHLAAADMYVLPSRHEGFPVALLEAMACGLPVVATAVPGVGEVLAGGEESGGIVIPPGRSDALAAAMRRVLDDPGLAQTLAKRARQRVEQEFSLDAVAARLRALLAQR